MLKLKFKKAAKLTAMALTFGVVASAAFQGTNFLFNQMDGDSQEEQEAKLNVPLRYNYDKPEKPRRIKA